MNLNKFKEKPFFLNDDNIKWIEKTYNKLSLEEKVGQLFFMVGRSYDEEYLKYIVKELHIGGIMSRSLEVEKVVNIVNYCQGNSKIPLLVAANLESGGDGIVVEGTRIGTNMMVAATNDVKYAKALGEISAKEGKAVGANYAFAPVCDIDLNFRNPITNTRTFGSNQNTVYEMSKAYMKAVQENNVCCSIKHFPGDGIDERDQHLVTSINSLSSEDWYKSYGNIYKKLIDDGVKTVMIGHIMLPSIQKELNPLLKDEELLPATLSKELLQNLLRDKLNFNGLIITDATTMAGFNIPMERKKAVPMSIAAGCDMFLFTKNLAEDYSYMLEGVRENIITSSRLNDAVLRILALKASLGLDKKIPKINVSKALDELKFSEALKLAKEVARKSIVLVKEEKGLLPIQKNKHLRVLLYGIESGENAIGYKRLSLLDRLKNKLEYEGFEVTVFEASGTYEGLQQRADEIKNNYDLIIYLCSLATKSNQTTVRIEWTNPMGINVPIYINSIPTIFVSTENPYHLLDVPRVKTYINTYGSNDYTIDCLVDKLLGKDEFVGVDPVDSFCGKWDTHL